jgi:hypothetical protein
MMLSAEKDANRTTPTTLWQTSSNGGAVGKVVNSIQSLRQRLDDYTLEEVADAENRSRTLLSGLSSLQLRVESLAAIKLSMTAVSEAIEQARAEDVMPTTCELSDKTLRLQDIVQASNLIKFTAVRKLPAQASRLTLHKASVSNQVSSATRERPTPIKKMIEADPVTDHQETPDCPEEFPFVFDAEEIETGLADPSANFSWGEETAGVFNKDSNHNLKYNQDSEVDAVNSTAEAINSAAFLSASEHDQVRSDSGEPKASTSTALVPSGGDFDQRLLDDLIKNYGEFFGSSDSRVKVESQTKIETDKLESSKILLETPVVEKTKDNTARALPLKKEGDIDRQLKKIIKDYGEYDIYSRQSPINLKFAMIGAFLLLGAVFSGFYFLSSSKSHDTSSLPASAQPASMISTNDNASSDSKRANEASETKALNRSTTPNR